MLRKAAVSHWASFFILLLNCVSGQEYRDCSVQREKSVYEQYCCRYINRGKTIKFTVNSVRNLILCPNEQPVSCFDFDNNSCSEILSIYPSTESGYYSVGQNQTSVYCDMEGVNCDGEGGWTRVAYLNMSEPGATCPLGLYQQNYNNLDHPVCGRPTTLQSGGCASHVYSTLGMEYTKVCGRVRGYQKSTPDGAGGDLVSIALNSSSTRVWTFVAAWSASNVWVNCPCAGYTESTIPDNYYFCESGVHSGLPSNMLYADDPLWDGQQCHNLDAACCSKDPTLPWFLRTFGSSKSEDILFSVCLDQSYNDEDIPIDIIEIYIK